MEFIVVLWLLCACASAAIMSGKTDSQQKVILYFVGGLLLGVLGILLAAVAPNEKVQGTAAAELLSQARKKCPYCKEAVLADAIKCRYCGEAIT